MIPSMSYATKTKVKPCTECRVGTVTVRKTVAGSGSANGLFQNQFSTATGLTGVPMVNNLTSSAMTKTTKSCRE